jgi:tetrapyrrole methylase family protein/MazG family protein
MIQSNYNDKKIVKKGDRMPDLFALARYLRSSQGCPWDRKQKAQNFAHYLKDESIELIEAFQAEDHENMEEEFGDCLFTLLACAAAAEEEGLFSLDSALAGIREKMIRRHDHVFGDTQATTPEEVMESWERIKAREKKEK